MEKQPMRKLKVSGLGRYILFSVVFLVLFFACSILIGSALLSFARQMCRNTIILTEPSPNGKYQAIGFLRDCGGATGAFTPHVSILNTNVELPNEKGNVFIGNYGETYIDIEWQSDHELTIRYTMSDTTSEDEPTLKLKSFNDIIIAYEVVKPEE